VYTPNPSSFRNPSSQNAFPLQDAPRTCECLTQSICCHGCGNSVGYMIVKPVCRKRTFISLSINTIISSARDVHRRSPPQIAQRMATVLFFTLAKLRTLNAVTYLKSQASSPLITLYIFQRRPLSSIHNNRVPIISSNLTFISHHPHLPLPLL
jgi:hypothetical protein